MICQRKIFGRCFGVSGEDRVAGVGGDGRDGRTDDIHRIDGGVSHYAAANAPEEHRKNGQNLDAAAQNDQDAHTAELAVDSVGEHDEERVDEAVQQAGGGGDVPHRRHQDAVAAGGDVAGKHHQDHKEIAGGAVAGPEQQLPGLTGDVGFFLGIHEESSFQNFTLARRKRVYLPLSPETVVPKVFSGRFRYRSASHNSGRCSCDRAGLRPDCAATAAPPGPRRS